MSQKRKGLLMLFLMFGVLMFVAGITGLTSRKRDYNQPIYISQEFELYGETSKTIIGQLKNRTNLDVNIETLSIYISTHKQGNKIYYDNLTYKNIVVPANGVYDFKQTGIHESFYYVSLSYCIINGERCSIKYSSDGITFENSKNQYSKSILFLIGGVILLGLSVFIIIDYFVKKEKIRY